MQMNPTSDSFVFVESDDRNILDDEAMILLGTVPDGRSVLPALELATPAETAECGPFHQPPFDPAPKKKDSTWYDDDDLPAG